MRIKSENSFNLSDINFLFKEHQKLSPEVKLFKNSLEVPSETKNVEYPKVYK